MLFRAWRIGELLPRVKKDLSGLHIKHVFCMDECLVVFISRSKTDQFKKGSWMRITFLFLEVFGGQAGWQPTSSHSPV